MHCGQQAENNRTAVRQKTRNWTVLTEEELCDNGTWNFTKNVSLRLTQQTVFRKRLHEGSQNCWNCDCRGHRYFTLWRIKCMKRIAIWFQLFSGKNSRVINNVLLRCAFSQEDKIFIICSSNGKFLFDSHNVIIIPADLCLALVTECLASWDAAYDTTLADRRLCAYR